MKTSKLFFKAATGFIFSAVIAILPSYIHAQNKKPVNQPLPSCENLIGIWHNDLESSLIIENIDTSTNQITGKYISPSGAGRDSFLLIGWVNYAGVNPKDPCKDYKKNNRKVLSFTVRWGPIGSITAWTGTCSLVKGTSEIKTMWNLARPNTQFDWDHILNGSDTFVPGPPISK